MLLASRADGTKLRPLVIFKGSKPKKNPPTVNGVDIAYTENGWIDEGTITMWMRRAIGYLRSDRTLLIWDTYAAHMTERVRNEAVKCHTDLVYVPGGCTGLVQPADVSWNKPFKGK